jgi:ankyrin repeat protein
MAETVVIDGNPVAAFIEAASVPLDADHRSGTLERAQAILVAHPEVARSGIHAPAILGDVDGVARSLESDPGAATTKGGPRGWDALTYLCFSRYLRLDRRRSEGFVRAATALLDAGANANTGFYSEDHEPEPVWESAIYGAAGVAHHAALTTLLLERGADPNDEETPYHAPETLDNAAVRALVESGKLNADSVATLLLRKADWHDHDGIKWLIEHGADANRMTRWHHTALHQAVRRDNHIANIEVMLEHGADATLPNRRDGRTAVSIAARRGRGDVLALVERRGVPIDLEGVERLIAACARDDAAGARGIAEREPALLRELIAKGGTFLAEFAGNGNSGGVEILIDLGVDVDALYVEGDGYFGIAPGSTALHVAAWRAWPSTVKGLLARGATVNRRDGHGRTPLALAVRACVDSYWTGRRSPESVEALLEAGASLDGVSFPSGYAEVDALLAARGRIC